VLVVVCTQDRFALVVELRRVGSFCDAVARVVEAFCVCVCVFGGLVRVELFSFGSHLGNGLNFKVETKRGG
jgi:hypothetical protein